MSREIKFRGLADNRAGDAYFVYGMLSHDLPGSTAYYDTHSFRICWHPESGGEANCPVRNGTVGEFTGLHDRNGVEIYEGDIVECPWPRAVFWDECSWSVKSGVCFTGDAAKISKVIGNIHENPELLNQEAP